MASGHPNCGSGVVQIIENLTTSRRDVSSGKRTMPFLEGGGGDNTLHYIL
jgi:hypothetical protein